MSIGDRYFDRVSLIYGFAHFGKSLFWYASEILFAYYFSEVAGLSTRAMGWTLALGFAIGALADIGVAKSFSAHFSDARSAARLQVLGSVFSSVSLFGLFASAFVPEFLRVGYVLVIGMAFRIAYAAYDLPQNALLSLGTRNTKARSLVSAARAFYSGCAALIVGGVGGALVIAQGPTSAAVRFAVVAALFSLVAIATSFGLSRLEWTPPFIGDFGAAELTIVDPKGQSLPPQLVGLLFFSIMQILTGSFFTRLEPYFGAYALRSGAWAGSFMIAISFGRIVSQPIWVGISIVLGPIRLLRWVTLASAAAALGFWFTASIPPGVVAMAFLIGAATGGVGMAQWAAYGDAVAKHCRDGAGLAYAVLTAAMKLSLGVGVIAIGEGLNHIDYRGGQSSLLAMLMGIVPAIGGVLGVFFLPRGTPRGPSARPDSLSVQSE